MGMFAASIPVPVPISRTFYAQDELLEAGESIGHVRPAYLDLFLFQWSKVQLATGHEGKDVVAKAKISEHVSTTPPMGREMDSFMKRWETYFMSFASLCFSSLDPLSICTG